MNCWSFMTKFMFCSHSISVMSRQWWFSTAVIQGAKLLKEAPSYICFHDLSSNTYFNSKQEKAMAPHSSTLAWKIPWIKEPGGLQSIRSIRVGHNWATSLSLFTLMHWRRKWQPTPVFLPGESQGQRSLVGFHLWGRTESDTTEAT